MQYVSLFMNANVSDFEKCIDFQVLHFNFTDINRNKELFSKVL